MSGRATTRAAFVVEWLMVSLLAAGVPFAREWLLVNPLPTDADLAGVACGPPGCVAVGEAGTILAGGDGSAWTVVPTPVTLDLAAVTWSGSRFVAVGAGGTILASRDGRSWEPRASGTAAGLDGVCAGPMGLLVAVGEGGTILTSTDGRTWLARASGTATTLRDVTWAEQGFVAVGDADGIASVLTSADARTWRPDQRFQHGSYRFVAARGARVVLGGPTAYLRTGDLTGGGLGETSVGDRSGHAGLPADVVWCDDRFVAVTSGPSVYSGGNDRHSSSLDGVTWEGTPSTGQWLPLLAVTCGPHGPVAVGLGGQTATSPDRVHWRRGSGQVEEALVVAGDQDVAVALTVPDPEEWGYTSSQTLASRDGIQWSGPAPWPVGDFWASGLAYGTGRFVAAGGRWMFPPPGSGSVAVSADGVTWEHRELGVNVFHLSAATWDGDRFVAVGPGWIPNSVMVCTSVDGTTWEGQHTTGWAPVALASDGERLVGVSHDGYLVLRLADGLTWEEIQLPVEGPWWDLAFAAGKFVLVGAEGRILTSPDGAGWMEQASGTDRNLYGADRIGDGLVVTGAGGTLLTSADGVSWQLEPTGLAGDLMSAAPGACGLTVTGRHGLIATTACPEETPQRAAFAWRPPTVLTGSPVTLLDRSTPAPDRWRWDLGDGAAATGPAAVQAWTDPGVYPVTLEVGSRHGAASATATVEVLAPCAAVGVPGGLAAPAQVGRHEDVTLTWEAVDGADGYRVESVTCGLPIGCFPTQWDVQEPVCSAGSRGDSMTFRVQSVRRCFDGAWRSEWSDPVTVRVLSTITATSGACTVVPAAAHGPGASGQSWATDLLLRNRGGSSSTAEVFPLDGMPRVGKLLEVDVEASRTTVVADVLARIPGAPSSCGLLVCLGPGLQLEARSRSAHASEVTPTVPLEEVVRDHDARFLTGLLREGTMATNVGVANPGDEPVAVRFYFYDAAGDPLGAVELEPPAHGSATATDVLGRLGHADVSGARATVRGFSPGWRPYVAWSSVVDRASGDAVTRLPLQRDGSWSVLRTGGDPLLGSAATFGHGRYVVAADGIAWSDNGRDWHHQDLGFDPEAVRWNGESFVAVGGGRVARSPDAEQWQELALPRGELLDLVWTGAGWLAVGLDGDGDGRHGIVGRSPDGLEWELTDLPDTPAMGRVAPLGAGFVATASDGVVLASPDGDTWATTWEPDGRWWPTFDLASSGSIAVVAGGLLGVSTDGHTWYRGRQDPRTVDWVGDRFIAWNDGLTTSRDGLTWRSLGLLRSITRGYPVELAWDGAVAFGPSTTQDMVWLVEHGQTLVVPRARHGVDDRGRFWQTDLDLTNTGDEEASCALDPLGPQGPMTPPVTVTVPASTTLRLDDVLDSLFGLEGEAAVRVAPSAPTVVGVGRTWAPTAGGTVGQAAPALPEETAIWSFAEGRLGWLERSDTVVTDLGVVSLCGDPMTVEVLVRDGGGSELGRLALDLPPFAARTLDDVLLAVGASEDPSASATLTTDTLRCPFLAFASRLDLATGDRVLVPAAAVAPGGS